MGGYNVSDEDGFRTARRRAFRFLEQEDQARILRNLRRNWERHPELRSTYLTFERYLAANRDAVFA